MEQKVHLGLNSREFLNICVVECELSLICVIYPEAKTKLKPKPKPTPTPAPNHSTQ